MLSGAGAHGQPEELEAVLCLCMPMPMAARAGDMLWQCLDKVSRPGWNPLALVSLAHPLPCWASQWNTQPQQCPTAPALGRGGAPMPSATPMVRAAPGWHSLWERGRSQGRVQSLQERAVNLPGDPRLLSRCSRERARPCGNSLDAFRGIPQAEIPAGSSKLLPIFADKCSCWARQAPFPGSVPSLCVRGAAGWQEALSTSSSNSRKAQVLKR